MSNPAESYESFMVPTLFAPWASRLVDAANPQSGDRVLDVGCGTGIVARQVAPRVAPGGTVTGLDPSPHMLEVARAAAAREGHRVDWREGAAEELPFGDGTFDLVLSQFALMFFADRSRALSEIHRALRKGGRLCLSVWQGLDRHPFYRRLHDVILDRVGISALKDIFALGNLVELRGLLQGAGFQGVEIESVSMTARFPNPESFLAGEIDVDTAAIPSMQGLDDAARQSLIAAISEEMKAPLAGVTEQGHVVMPCHAHIAQATRA